MKEILKKSVIILGVYIIFILYLYVAIERIERLENGSQEKKSEVEINISE